MMNLKKHIFVILLVCFFIGCATLPPTTIENGIYTNPKYSFSLRIPDGWTPKEKIPTEFRYVLTEEERQQIKLMIFNAETNGLLAIKSYKSFFPIAAIDEKRARQNIEGLLEKKKKKFYKDTSVQNYSYTISTIYLVIEEIDYISDFMLTKCFNRMNMYECHEDDTCILEITLVSNALTYDQNYETYEKVLDSLVYPLN